MTEQRVVRAVCGCQMKLGAEGYVLEDPCEFHCLKKVQANESVGDSFLDLANYAIFGYMFMNGTKMESDEAFFNNYEQALQTLREVTKDRRKKYGAGNLLIHRERGLVVRLADKLSRLTHHYFPQELK